MGCGASASAGSKDQGPDPAITLQRFEAAVEASDVSEVFACTGLEFRQILTQSCDADLRRRGAALLLDAVLAGTHCELGEENTVKAAVFLDSEVRPADTFDASQLLDDRIHVLLLIEELRSFLAPVVSSRLQEAVQDKEVMRTCRYVHMLADAEISLEETVSSDSARREAALFLMKAVLCGTAPVLMKGVLSWKAALVDAAAAFSKDESLYRDKLGPEIADLDSAAIQELLCYPLCSAALAPELCTRVINEVDKDSLDSALEMLDLFKIAVAAADESTQQEAATRLMRTALNDVVLEGDEPPCLPECRQKILDVATLICPDREMFKSAMPDYAAVIDALMTGNWQVSPSGDSTAGDWEDLPPDLSRLFEQMHKVYVDATSRPGRLQFSQVQRFDLGDISYTCDMQYLTLRSDGHVKPVRRLDSNGAQTHPDPEQKHPWYLRRIELKEAIGGKGDWLTNEYFWSAFSEAMAAAGHRVESTAEEIFDFRFNQDWRAVKKDNKSEVLKRGGEDYHIPCGWKKFAVRVKGKYDSGDDAWLGLDGSHGEWAVAYHGTKHNCLPGILENGIFVGPVQVWANSNAIGGGKVGNGVYCTPNIDEVAALECYAKPATAGGHEVQFVMQCRVRPSAIKKVHEPTRSFGRGLKYDLIWVINDPKDIRPYAVLVRGRDAEWKPAAVETFTNITNEVMP